MGPMACYLSSKATGVNPQEFLFIWGGGGGGGGGGNGSFIEP